MKIRHLLVALAACVLIPSAAFAEDWHPRKAITIITPTPAGSIMDMLARTMIPSLQESLGVPIIVSPTPGGGNVTAIMKALGAQPDGHTILTHGSVKIALAGLLRSDRFGFDDLYPIALLDRSNTCFVSKLDGPYQTFQDFVAAAKANPGKLNVGVIGVKTGYHNILLTEMQNNLDFRVNVIPFEGTGPAFAALLGGHIDACVQEMPNDGARVLLLMNGRLPVEGFDDVPTLEDLGYTPLNFFNRNTFYVRSDMPREIIDVLRAAINEAKLNNPEFSNMLTSYARVDMDGTPEELKDMLIEDRNMIIRLQEAGALELE